MNKTRDVNSAPIHLAALNMGHDSLDNFLSKGADPNIRDDRGRTPLHHAAFYGYAENVKALLAAGAEPNARDNEDWTPLNAADSGRNDHRVIYCPSLAMASSVADSMRLRERPKLEQSDLS